MAPTEKGDLSTQKPADIELKHPSCSTQDVNEPKIDKEEAPATEATAGPSGELDQEPASKKPEEAPRPKKKRKRQSYKDLMSSLKVIRVRFSSPAGHARVGSTETTTEIAFDGSRKPDPNTASLDLCGACLPRPQPRPTPRPSLPMR